MDMEDCKEMVEHRPLHVSGCGTATSPPVPAPSSLAASYPHHSQQAPRQTQQQNAHLHTPPLHPHQLPHAHQHFNYPLMRTHGHGLDADDLSMTCTGRTFRTCDGDILVHSTGKENHACANDAPACTTNAVHLHQTNNVDVRLMKPYPSYTSLHVPDATLPNAGVSAVAMGTAMHHQETHSIIANPSISEASTTTPPQASGTAQTFYAAVDTPLPDPSKKKRGRARKGSVDGSFSVFTAGPSSVALSPPTKTSYHYRGRRKMSALDQGLRPHIIAIARGEDVSVRITSFQKEGNWKICVLSALGSISNVTLRHSETSGGTITYEGCYDILSLSGSMSPIGDEGNQKRGGLIVSLAGLDGQVIGGEVTGMFVAASPIKVVVGSFLSEAQASPVNISQAGMAAASSSCATIPVQQTSMLDCRLGNGVGDSHQYQHPLHMVTSHFIDTDSTRTIADAAAM